MVKNLQKQCKNSNLTLLRTQLVNLGLTLPKLDILTDKIAELQNVCMIFATNNLLHFFLISLHYEQTHLLNYKYRLQKVSVCMHCRVSSQYYSLSCGLEWHYVSKYVSRFYLLQNISLCIINFTHSTRISEKTSVNEFLTAAPRDHTRTVS